MSRFARSEIPPGFREVSMIGALRVSPVAASLLVAFAAVAQQTVTLQDSATYAGTSDARLLCCANTPEGAAQLFDLIPDDTTSVLIKFKIFASEGGPVPDASTIQAATLAFYRNDGPASIFAVHRVLRAWDEAAVSWLNTGASGAWSSSGGAFPPDIASGADSQVTMPASTGCPADPPAPASCWFRFDVTASVSAFSGNVPTNNGWKLRYVSDADGTQTSSHTPKEFYSSENTRGMEMRPTLTVTWSQPS